MHDRVVAEAQGLATARNLSQYAINIELAPVFDTGRGGFITPRTFGSTPASVALRATAFARGLARGGVLATAKHFPGLGYATATTDVGAVTITASATKLNADLAPFKAAIAAGIPLVMVSTAIYPALHDTVPAATSPAIISDLLRDQLGYNGVVITDALDTAGVSPYYTPGQAALRALAAGADLVIAAGATPADADRASTSAFNTILAAARSGALPRTTLETSYQCTMALKASLPR